MPILLMVNLKDGVANTTNTVVLAECFAESGLRTLVVDADHHVRAEGLNRIQEGGRVGRQVPLEHRLAVGVQDVDVHGPGVQIDPTVESVPVLVAAHVSWPSW
jgi:Mrp family chromosome partitioning ATPase